MDVQLGAQADTFLRLYLIPIAWRLLGAGAIWLIGSWAIRLLRQALKRFMRIRTIDPTLATYLDTSAGVVLQLLVLIVVLGVLGVETTSLRRCSRPRASRSARPGLASCRTSPQGSFSSRSDRSGSATRSPPRA